MAREMKVLFRLTRHGEIRANQRGIRRAAIDVLLAYGEAKHSRGAEMIFMTQAARARAREDLGRTKYAQVEGDLDKVVVADGDRVVTLVPRTRRIRM